MKSHVLPDLVLLSISLGLALYEIVGWSVRRPRREDFSLALLFITCALYAGACAGQYGADSIEATVPWLRLQSVMLFVSGIGLTQFFSAVTGMIPSRSRMVLTLVFGAFAATQILGLDSLTWDGSAGRIREIGLPMGPSWSIYEASIGPVTRVQIAVTLLFFPFIFEVARRFRRKDRIKGRRLMAIPVVIIIAWANDLAAMFGLLHTPYAMEYAFIVGAVYAALERAERERDAERRIRDSLAEKEVLIGELYHRTKNNMQIVTSLLRLHANELDSGPAKAILKDVTNQIMAMSLVHQKLYESKDLSDIRAEVYLRDLVALLRNSHGATAGMIEVVADVEDMPLAIDTAIPLGLVISEILTNSFKHAFPAGRKGRISIGLKSEGEDTLLTMSDDGVGLPDGFAAEKDGRMGMRTLRALAERQLHGSIEMTSSGGLAYMIRLKRKVGPDRGSDPAAANRKGS